MGEILDALNVFEGNFFTKQKPMLMQPIWKTKGKTPFLADNAFDVFIWSDFALSRLFLDGARRMVDAGADAGKDSVFRLMRSSARFTQVSASSFHKWKAEHQKHLYGNGA